MTIEKRIILDDEEQDLFQQVYDILTNFYNELDDNRKRKEIDNIQNLINQFTYDYGSDEYRANY